VLFVKRFEYALLIGLIFSAALANFSGFASEWEGLRGEVLRLHILANSDSGADQALKYAVRDRILAECGGLFAGLSPAQARKIAEGRLPELERLAARVIAEHGATYSVSARLVRMRFPTRVYGGVAVAAGYYDAVRIVIGGGGGQNWWCVMFPPMCLPAAAPPEPGSAQEQLEDLGEPRYIPKLALLELIEQLTNNSEQ
jgi:stage II sporulation protein R